MKKRFQLGTSLPTIVRKEKDRKAPSALCLGKSGIRGGTKNGAGK